MGTVVEVRHAKAHLSRLIERAKHGEAIFIAKDGRIVARLTAEVDRPVRRVPGGDAGVIIHSNFDDPIPEFDPDYLHPGDPLRNDIKPMP